MRCMWGIEFLLNFFFFYEIRENVIIYINNISI